VFQRQIRTQAFVFSSSFAEFPDGEVFAANDQSDLALVGLAPHAMQKRCEFSNGFLVPRRFGHERLNCRYSLNLNRTTSFIIAPRTVTLSNSRSSEEPRHHLEGLRPPGIVIEWNAVARETGHEQGNDKVSPLTLHRP